MILVTSRLLVRHLSDSEKAISIGQYFVASGVFTVFGVTWPTLGSEEVTKMLFEGFDEIFKGKWAFQPDPIKAAG